MKFQARVSHEVGFEPKASEASTEAGFAESSLMQLLAASVPLHTGLPFWVFGCPHFSQIRERESKTEFTWYFIT